MSIVVLKTYEKESVNCEKLHNEILLSNSVQDFAGLNHFNGNLQVAGEEILNEENLDTVVNNHEFYSLSEYKTKKHGEIDLKTQSLINKGFSFQNKDFSLSREAQLNWMSLMTMQAMYTWPVALGTIDGNEYLLSLANMQSFVGTALGTVKSRLDSGRNLKVSVSNCLTIKEVDSIIDNRN